MTNAPMVANVSDGAPRRRGIAAAVAEALLKAGFQRCWTHQARNLLDAPPPAERTGCRTVWGVFIHPSGSGVVLVDQPAEPVAPLKVSR